MTVLMAWLLKLGLLTKISDVAKDKTYFFKEIYEKTVTVIVK